MSSQVIQEIKDPEYVHKYINFYYSLPFEQYDRPSDLTSITYNFGSPIIDNSNEWEVNLESLTLSGVLIPICIWNSNATLGTSQFYVGIRSAASGILYQAPVMYKADSNNPVTITNQFIYSYNNLCDMFNLAFNVAYLAYNAANPGVLSGPPILTFSPTTNLFSLVVKRSEYLGTDAEIFVNRNSASLLFYSFHTIDDLSVIFTVNNPSDTGAQIVVEDLQYNNVSQFPYLTPLTSASAPGDRYLMLSQEYPTISSIISCSSIRVLVDFMGLDPEFSGNVQGPFSSSSTQQFADTLLSDFFIDPSQAGDLRNKLTYNPAYPKYHSITAPKPLNLIRMSFKWLSNNSQFEYPLLPQKGKIITAKLHF